MQHGNVCEIQIGNCPGLSEQPTPLATEDMSTKLARIIGCLSLGS